MIGNITSIDAIPEILIVDDLKTTLDFFKLILEEAKYKVTTFDNGKDALNYLKTNIPDIILLDVVLPDIDGYKICKLIKANEKLKNIPVIFISALKKEDDKVKGYEAGGVDFITKPYYKGEIISKVNNIIALRRFQFSIENTNILLEKENKKNTEIIEVVRQSERKYHALFENANEAIFFMNNEFFIDCNVRTVELFGLDRKEDIIGRSPWEFSPKYQPDGKESKEKAKEFIDAALKGIPQRFYWLHTKKNGELIDCEVSLNKLELNDKTYIQALVYDVTKQKTLEKERFKLLDVIEKSVNEIYIFNSSTLKFEYLNKVAINNLGYSKEEMYEMTPLDIKPEFNEESFKKMIKPLLNGEKENITFETVHKRKNKTTYPVEVNLQLYKYKDTTLFIAVILDITERRKNIEALKLSEELFRTTIYSIGDGVITTDIDGRIMQMNTIAEQLTGWKETEARGMAVTEVFKIVNEDTFITVENPIEKVLKEGEIVGLANHTLLIAKDGKFRPIADSGAPIKNSKGQTTGVVLVFRDQTVERLKQKTLKTRLDLFEFASKYDLKNALTKSIDEICNLSKSEFGFFHFLNPDQETIHIQAWSSNTPKDFCKLDEKESRCSFSKTGLKNDCISRKAPLIINDFKSTGNDVLKPNCHLLLKKEILVPVVRNDKVVAIFGVANKLENYTETDLEVVCLLADVLWEISENKRVEEELKKSENRYRTLFETAKEGILGLDDNLNIVYANNKIAQMLDYTVDELIGMNYADITFPEEMPDILKKEEERKIGEVGSYERKLRKKNGEEIVALASISTVSDEEGKYKGSVKMFTDITERKKAELKIKELSRQQEIMISNLPGFVYRCYYDKDWTMQYISNGCFSITGYTPDEFIRKTPAFNNIIHPDYQDYLYEKWQTVIENKEMFSEEYLIYSKSGDLKWVWEQGQAVFDDKGNFSHLEGFITDITDKKLNEQKLVQASENWNRTFRAMKEGVALLDKDQKILECNESFLNFVGKKKEEVVGQNCYIHIHGEICPIEGCPFVKAKSSLRRETMEMAIDDRICEIIVDPIIDENNNITGAVHITSDITERRKMENELIKAKEKAEESDRLKSAFLANMSHEIRTPMNGILGFADLLKEPDLDGEKQKMYIEIIEKSGNRMLNIINDIISISKIEAGIMDVIISETNINEQLEFIYTFFKPEADAKGIGLKFDCELPYENAVVSSDREKIFAVLTNLVKNAIKFTFQGEISFGYKLTNNNKEIEFYVKDTGIGIPEDRLDAVFERFVQADITDKDAYQGAGLGLSISKAYVEMLGGKIWAESKVGKGSQFYFTLPYKKNKSEIINDKPYDNAFNDKAIKKLKVLIVEDDEASEFLLMNTLKNISDDILVAKTGIEAVEMCYNNIDIDLILMDLQLPGISGYDAVKQIREFNNVVKIIAQTAYALDGDREKAIEAGCDDYIAKPIKLTDLVQKINNIINV